MTRHATKYLYSIIMFASLARPSLARTIPKEFWGKWIVRRELPTNTISCWSEKEAHAILGTEIEYSTELFRWKNIVTRNPAVEATEISAQQFHDEESGHGAGSSQVTFQQLGITSSHASKVSIRHPAAKISRSTTEIPGDEFLAKDQNTIIFAVCNVYFEANRSKEPKTTN